MGIQKTFRTVKDQVLLPQEAFNDYFGEYFENYEHEDGLIIHPHNAAAVEKYSINLGLISLLKSLFSE